MHTLLLHGDHDNAYARGNLQRGGKNTPASDHAWALTRALAAGAARAGWTRAAFLQVLLDGPYKAGHHARRLQHRHGYDKAAAWLQRAWDGAHHYIQTTDPITTRQDFHASLAALRARIERTPWPGLAGKTDLRNLITRMDICTQAGTWDHTLSERHLAERMGCSRTTARASNQRLIHTGLLRRLDHGTPAHGARWMLVSPLPRTTSHHQPTHKGPLAGGAMNGSETRQAAGHADINTRAIADLMHHDAFAHRGLGGSGLAILAALAERDGQTATELRDSASVSRATVYRQLTKLTTLGLVQHHGETYHLSPTALDGTGQTTPHSPQPATGWNDVAQRLGTAGTAQHRRTRHENERHRWHRRHLRLTQHRRPANLTPLPHPALAHPQYIRADGQAVDPRTGLVIEGLYAASDGHWIWEEHPEPSATPTTGNAGPPGHPR